MSGYFLGGSLGPLGLMVMFLRRPVAQVLEGLLTWRRKKLHEVIMESAPAEFPACTAVLDPMEAPWTVELLIDCGAWTAYLNNWVHGGDPKGFFSGLFNCDCLVATHVPYRSWHPTTALQGFVPTIATSMGEATVFDRSSTGSGGRSRSRRRAPASRPRGDAAEMSHGRDGTGGLTN